MRSFNYEKIYCSLLKPEIINLIMQIQEYKGKQLSFNKNKAMNNVLEKLKEETFITDLKLIHNIDGISNRKLKLIAINKAILNNEKEKTIAGYRDIVYRLDEESYILRFNYLFDIYHELYKYDQRKQYDAVYADEEKQQINSISENLNQLFSKNIYNLLIIIPVVILDFWNICKSNEDKYRICSLILIWFMYKSGYEIGKYVSIEKIIQEQKDIYLSTIKASSLNWDKESNDYSIFAEKIFNIIILAYKEFFSKTSLIDISNGFSKRKRIIETVKKQTVAFTRASIMEECPDISQVTVERTLNNLLKTNRISKIQGGKYTKYIYIGKEENNDNRRIEK